MPSRHKPSRRGKPYGSVAAIRAVKDSGWIVWTAGTWWEEGIAYWHKRKIQAMRRVDRMRSNSVPAWLVPVRVPVLEVTVDTEEYEFLHEHHVQGS
jgi:hypothetical protein